MRMAKKELYRATNLDDLRKQAQYDLSNTAIKLVESIMSKCFEKACSHRVADEEAAYILFMRYFECYDRLKKVESRYVNQPATKKQVFAALGYLEELSESLKSRYAELQNRSEAATEEEVEASSKMTEPEPNPKAVEKSIPTVANGWITVADLVSFLRQKRSILLIDLRSSDEFELCHIKHSRLLSVPAATVLKPG